MRRLKEYFTEGIVSETLQTIGAEIETQFVDLDNNPISTQMSQQMLMLLVERGEWRADSQKGGLITSLVDSRGNKIFYELGRHNIEVATAVSTPDQVLSVTQGCLDQVYEAAQEVGAKPYFAPILPGEEDLLVIPDERDATWLELDGRDALAPLARASAVQFTISVASEEAIEILNALGRRIDLFLSDYPQDAIWRRYIAESFAGYIFDRYGGPLAFESLDDYCQSIIRHDVVEGSSLVPFASMEEVDIPLYLRSVWWYFRLKRYGDALCVEVRPIARRTDDKFQDQLKMTLAAIC